MNMLKCEYIVKLVTLDRLIKNINNQYLNVINEIPLPRNELIRNNFGPKPKNLVARVIRTKLVYELYIRLLPIRPGVASSAGPAPKLRKSARHFWLVNARSLVLDQLLIRALPRDANESDYEP